MGGTDCKILSVVILSLLLCSCVKDRPNPVNPTPASNGNVYIICEGNFGSGNATLYSYNTATDSVFGDIYSTVNNTPLGDVFQSMKKINDTLFLCVNNSDKIVLLDANTHKYIGAINVPKPRYILPVTPEKAYVSTLYSSKVYMINPRLATVTGTVELPYANAEGMCLYSDYLFVCPWDTACNKVYKIDITSGQIVQAVEVPGYAPHAVVVDKEQMLWVMSGNTIKGKDAMLTRIDPTTGNVLKSIKFPHNTDPIKPTFNPTKDTLYFIEVRYDGSVANNGIYRISINDTALPDAPFIPTSIYQYFWALSISPATGEIYVGDPIGFTQKGKVYVYNTNGVRLKSFNVGLGPGNIYFGN